MYSVFLSGNGPLVRILQEALARDKIRREKEAQRQIRKKEALSEVKAFVQNVHHYRDEYLKDPGPPADHVALFDEAQRAWDLEQTVNFMRRKKNRPDFNQSEPEFLISCIDRHPDWGVIVCLVGGGQEINTGEAGIGEWIESLNRSFLGWHIHISNRLTDSEYGARTFLAKIKDRPNVTYSDDLHLSISMRSFRAENVSLLIRQLLDLDAEGARKTFGQLSFVVTNGIESRRTSAKPISRTLTVCCSPALGRGWSSSSLRATSKTTRACRSSTTQRVNISRTLDSQ